MAAGSARRRNRAPHQLARSARPALLAGTLSGRSLVTASSPSCPFLCPFFFFFSEAWEGGGSSLRDGSERNGRTEGG